MDGDNLTISVLRAHLRLSSLGTVAALTQRLPVVAVGNNKHPMTASMGNSLLQAG